MALKTGFSRGKFALPLVVFGAGAALAVALALAARQEIASAAQQRFDAVAINSRSFGNARIGRDFIRKYRRLLPSGEACRQEDVGQAMALRLQ